MSYVEAGDGPLPVLLVHGNFAGKSWWREILTDPPQGSRLIAPDMPGFGGSTVNGRGFRPSIPFYAESLAGFLDRLGVDRALLVGHSFGGAVSMELALCEPDRFPAAFLLSPAPPTGLDTPWYLYPLLESYRRDRRALSQAIRHTLGNHVPPYLDEFVAEAQLMHPAGFSGNARALERWSAASRKLRSYKSLVLVASGNLDPLISPASARATARAFPVSQYVSLGDIGHSPQVEVPHLVRRLLTLLVNYLREPESQQNGR